MKKMPPRPVAYANKVALVLQGGGALGSYQAGVFERLSMSDYRPDWVAGISIGAINAAIIAGNPPETQVARLREFWQRITPDRDFWPLATAEMFAPFRRQSAAQSAVLLGQPGFFQPQPLAAWLRQPGPTSYYDTSALKLTLESLVDFDRINAAGGIRLSVGAVNVRTGRFSYFDSDHLKIRVEHIMASGALPPGFPAVEIDGEQYWDGGLVSNTPISYVLEYVPRYSRLIFQVDVFQAFGTLPGTLDEVAEREKDIRYSSRTRITTEMHSEQHEVRHAINNLLEILPPDLRATPQAKRLHRMGCVTEMDIVQLIYRPFTPQGSAKDFEFSRATMVERWNQGVSDAEATLEAAPWLAAKKPEIGVREFDVIHDLLVAEHQTQAAGKATDTDRLHDSARSASADEDP
jgi:NTE family protein